MKRREKREERREKREERKEKREKREKRREKRKSRNEALLGECCSREQKTPDQQTYLFFWSLFW
jgi:hypothetical protein